MVARATKFKTVPSIDGVPLLRVNMKQLCKMLSVSESHIYAKVSTGEYPSPMKTDAGNRWDAATVLAWYEAGCPHYKTWHESWNRN